MKKLGPNLACVALVIVFIIAPIRTIINRIYEKLTANAGKSYNEVADTFGSDYDIENPVTKTEGLVRMMERKLNSADTTEEQREMLQKNIKQAGQVGVMGNFMQYSNQKQGQNLSMMMMAQPRVLAAMPIMGAPMMMMPPQQQMIMMGGGAMAIPQPMPMMGAPMMMGQPQMAIRMPQAAPMVIGQPQMAIRVPQVAPMMMGQPMMG